MRGRGGGSQAGHDPHVGAVEGEADGARCLYRLRAEGAEAVRAYIEMVWGEAAARFRLATANTPRPRTQR